MATKSPGIYYTTYDNSEYTNPEAIIGTTIAIVGYAKKGPIGKPVEITSYNDFKKTFGAPISGQYSGMAVKNVLTAGGSVLFYRVADPITSSQSIVVAKKEVLAEDGRLKINSVEPKYEGTYNKNGTYVAELKNGDDTQKIYITAPSSGKWSKSNLYEQISEQVLNGNEGYTEFSTLSTTVAGVYDYNNEEDEEETVSVYTSTDEAKAGKYYSDEDCTIQAFIDSDSLLKESATQPSGGNKTKYDVVVKTSTRHLITLNSNASAEVMQIGFNNSMPFSNKFVKVYLRKAYGNKTDDGEAPKISELSDKIWKKQSGWTGNSTTLGFEISCGATSNTVNVEVTEDTTVAILANSINEQLANYYVEALKDGDGVYIKFTATKNLGNDKNPIEIKVEKTSEKTTEGETTYDNKGRLFAWAEAVETETLPGDVSDETQGKSKVEAYPEVGTSGNIANNFVITVFVSTSYRGCTFENTKTELNGTSLKIKGFTFDEDLTGSLFNESTKALKYITTEEEVTPNTGGIVEVAKLSNGQITLTNKGGVNAPEINDIYDDSTTAPAGYANLTAIIGETVDVDPCDTKSEVVVKTNGQALIPASEFDMVAFKSIEKGSGTTSITVVVETQYSPLDGTASRDILIYDEKVLKEKFDDVSFEIGDEKFFATLINEEVENGGSALINVDYKKNEATQTVTLLDGTYTLGKALTSESVAKTSAMAESDYNSYDYAVGNDGITEDDTNIFLDALDPTITPLANKDMFSFHVLITPDCIVSEVQDMAIALCEDVDDAVCLIDPPQGLTKSQVIDWHNGQGEIRGEALSSNKAITYWPWCKIYDSSEKKNIWVMPSVLIAPLYCTVDNNYGPQYAPAGEVNGVLSSVIDIEAYPNRADRDDLYTSLNRVNPIVKFGNGTIMTYGEKTLYRKNSTLTKVHTARMLCALKKEINSANREFIFMPSVDSNISRINANVTSILEKYKQNNGISTYTVICDSSNNTPETLQQDILYCDILVTPVGCIEQIEISFTVESAAGKIEA